MNLEWEEEWSSKTGWEAAAVIKARVGGGLNKGSPIREGEKGWAGAMVLGSDWLWGCRGRKCVVAPEVLAEVVALGNTEGGAGLMYNQVLFSYL